MPTRGQAIVLIGFMGTGKSATGLILARRTGHPLLDTDEMVSAHFGLPVPEIFASFGETAFREIETKVLGELPSNSAGIVVTGGGIVLRSENVRRLRELGRVICLEADLETLLKRLSNRGPRPLLQTEDPRATLTQLLRARDSRYREAADIRVDTSCLTPDQVADTVLKRLEKL